MPSELTFPDLLKTDRLVLRRYTAADALGLMELVEKNRGVLIRNFPQMAKGFGQVEEMMAFTEEKSLQWNDRRAFCYGIWLKDSKEQIGQILVKNLTWDVPSAELSYFIASQLQRKGFATEESPSYCIRRLRNLASPEYSFGSFPRTGKAFCLRTNLDLSRKAYTEMNSGADLANFMMCIIFR